MLQPCRDSISGLVNSAGNQKLWFGRKVFEEVFAEHIVRALGVSILDDGYRRHWPCSDDQGVDRADVTFTRYARASWRRTKTAFRIASPANAIPSE